MIQGVERKSSDGYITYCIMDVSDELKNVIREKLTLICHGRDKADSTRRMYSYKSTVKEFVKRYKENNVLQGNNRNKGMIGELLFQRNNSIHRSLHFLTLKREVLKKDLTLHIIKKTHLNYG